MWPTPVSNRTTGQAVLKTPSVSNAWQLGTILKAIALGDSVDGSVRLQIGARVVAAQTSLPLLAGQSLRLQVAETGRIVVLRSIGEQPQADPVRAGIRQNLPRQMPQASLLAAALSLGRPHSTLPAELTAAATHLASAIRDAGALTQTQGLRMAVRDSGNFLENRLSTVPNTTQHQQTNTLPRDWKAALLRFRDQLTQLQDRLAGNAGAKLPVRPVIQSPTGNAVTTPPAVTQGGPAGPSTAVVNPAGAQPTTLTSASLVVPAPAATTAASPATVVAAAAAIRHQGAAVQTAEVAVQTPTLNAQQSTSAPIIPPPMRHALPHPQPVVSSANLPTDALSLVGELIKGTDGALSRVRLNQLASITTDHGSRLVWLLELPVRHTDDRAEVVTLRIEKDEAGPTGQKESAWTVDLAFDLGSKGELRARVALRAGRVSVSFWADADQTRTDVRDKLPQLKTALEKKQLDVATLTAGAGLPLEAQAPSASLLETRA